MVIWLSHSSIEQWELWLYKVCNTGHHVQTKLPSPIRWIQKLSITHFKLPCSHELTFPNRKKMLSFFMVGEERTFTILFLKKNRNVARILSQKIINHLDLQVKKGKRWSKEIIGGECPLHHRKVACAFKLRRWGHDTRRMSSVKVTLTEYPPPPPLTHSAGLYQLRHRFRCNTKAVQVLT